MKVLLTLAALAVTAFAEVVTLDLTQYPQIRYDQPVILTVGQTLEVLLKENPSTGYIWEVLETELKKNNLYGVISPRGHIYEQDENRRGAVGVSGVRKFTLAVTKTGKGDLTFVHGRPWETNAKLDAGEDISAIIQKVISVQVLPPPPSEDKGKEDAKDKRDGAHYQRDKKDGAN